MIANNDGTLARLNKHQFDRAII
ncbi:hypothetical protein WH7805_11963 [Synechococcus sp. WH 7805]|nr:hypothetical protein WH7805_11963 [Synechococcus sp. WH 7805]